MRTGVHHTRLRSRLRALDPCVIRLPGNSSSHWSPFSSFVCHPQCDYSRTVCSAGACLAPGSSTCLLGPRIPVPKAIIVWQGCLLDRCVISDPESRLCARTRQKAGVRACFALSNHGLTCSLIGLLCSCSRLPTPLVSVCVIDERRETQETDRVKDKKVAKIKISQ